MSEKFTLGTYISEAYYNPKGNELNNEFIEIFITEKTNISQWVITTFDNDDYSLPYVSGLDYGDFVIIKPGTGKNDLDANDGLAYIFLNRGISILSNAGDEIALFDNKGRLVDFIRYNGGNDGIVLGNWPDSDPGIESKEGESIQLLGDDKNSSKNWVSGLPTESYFYSNENSPFLIIRNEKAYPRLYFDQNAKIAYDDCTEPGAISGCNKELVEREHNYAFEGEKIYWNVLVWDKNGDEKISKVYVKAQMGNETGLTEEFIEVNCFRNQATGLGNLTGMIYEGEEVVKWNNETMDWYTCELSVESPVSMHGPHIITAVAEDVDGLTGTAAEEEYWFFNPVIALGISGKIDFGEARPGSVVKSTTLTIGNAAESGSGVMLDMYIGGTDFYDPSNSGAMCPRSNVLKLSNFKYYAVSGSYNTCNYGGADAECYVSIPYYMTGAGAPANNNMQRVIDGTTPLLFGEYPPGNVLSPGSKMSINFKLSMPEPCSGSSFSKGSIKIVGEAV